MKPIYLVASSTEGNTGLSQYAQQLSKHVDATLITTTSSLPRTPGIDVHTLFTRAPLRLSLPRDGILHFTDQQLTFPLTYQKRKSLVTVHDLIPLARKDDPLFRRLYYRLVFQGIKHAQHLIADSQHTKNDLIHYLNIPEHRITVIPLGVDHHRYYPSHAKRDPHTILCVSSDMPRKNIRNLLHAFALIKKEIPHAKLIKIGAAQWPGARTYHKHLARKLNIHHNITWIDYVEDLPWYYRTATAVVFPSLYEGFGLPILEAMACGTPVVSSNRTSLPEVTGDAALLCEPTPNNLAQHLLSLLLDKKLAKKLSRKGINHAKHFNWQETARLTKAVYDRMLNE